MFSILSDSDNFTIGMPQCMTLTIPNIGYKDDGLECLGLSSMLSDFAPVSSCFQTSQPTKSGRTTANVWTEAEDELLLRLVDSNGPQNWKTITTLFNVESSGNQRKMGSIVQHWVRVLNPEVSRRKWTAAEDEALIAALRQCQPRAWKKVADLMEGRTDSQVVSRLRGLKKKHPAFHLLGKEYFP